MGDLTKNLSRKEFACKCGCGFDTVDIETADVIQGVCDYFHCSVVITSGCRCDRHNKNVGGSSRSKHKEARAGDCQFKGPTTTEVHEYLCKTYPDKYGFGVYDNFNHIDTRTGMSRWDERN